MKKVLALLAVLTLCMPAAALGAENRVSANATVESVNVYQLTAPFSGVVKPFDWDNGDRVARGETLFALETLKVYAPADGTVEALFAKEGDLAADVLAQYGSLAVLERPVPQAVEADTIGAYNEPENKVIHAGEAVYFEESTDKDNQGEGRVISVDGDHYVVEMTRGDFDNGDKVKLYRDEKLGSKSAIGTGTVVRAKDVTVTGAGRVLRCAVHQGDVVKKGQLMYELAAEDAQMEDLSAERQSPADGALEMSVVSGQQVYKGQLLGKVHDLSAFQVVAEVDEVDLDKVHLGDSLALELDRYPDVELSGTVTEIAASGVTKQNATYYNVTLSLSTSMELLPGMSATVWLN